MNKAIEVGEADFEKRDLTKTGEVVEYEQVGVHYLEFKRLFNKFSKSIKDIDASFSSFRFSFNLFFFTILTGIEFFWGEFTSLYILSNKSFILFPF